MNAEERIEYECICGKTLHINSKYAGRRGRCKYCGIAFTVPQVGEVLSVSLPGDVPDEAHRTYTPSNMIRCPECNALLSVGIKACLYCGSPIRSVVNVKKGVGVKHLCLGVVLFFATFFVTFFMFDDTPSPVPLTREIQATRKALSESEIRAGFSSEGRHTMLEHTVRRDQMYDPRSFRHVETLRVPGDSGWWVKITYWGKDAYGDGYRSTDIAEITADGKIVSIKQIGWFPEK